MNIVAIVGSLRKNSYNMMLAKTIKETYETRFDLEIADIGVLPLFNQDEEHDPPQAVKDFKKQVADANGVIIVTPEYNWSVPGVLKNVIDWMSRVDKVLIGKPILLIGASISKVGTVKSQLHLRQILASPGVQGNVLPQAGNEVYINFAEQKFDEDKGRLTDKATLEFLDQVIDRFINFVQDQN